MMVEVVMGNKDCAYQENFNFFPVVRYREQWTYSRRKMYFLENMQKWKTQNISLVLKLTCTSQQQQGEQQKSYQ